MRVPMRVVMPLRGSEKEHYPDISKVPRYPGTKVKAKINFFPEEVIWFDCPP